MIIRCWGARGSIPVSGRQYLKYGGDTPCIEIRT
ncbi:MAG: MBL fold metallo-hydrolase, partial [Deltaproteobacteria bacterium HGW-Deltaproteobacteria-11]